VSGCCLSRTSPQKQGGRGCQYDYMAPRLVELRHHVACASARSDYSYKLGSACLVCFVSDSSPEASFLLSLHNADRRFVHKLQRGREPFPETEAKRAILNLLKNGHGRHPIHPSTIHISITGTLCPSSSLAPSGEPELYVYDVYMI